METAATCKYYVTKLLGISPPRPNCVYDVRSGNVRDREQKSLFRVFYRSNGRRRKHRRVHVQESYVPSVHEDEVGAKIGGVRHVLEEDTVEDIEKKFQGFRNVFEKCKVKKKKPPRLYNVSSGLRFTLVANSMLMDGQKKANEAAAAKSDANEGAADVIVEEDDDADDDADDDDDDDGDDVADGDYDYNEDGDGDEEEKKAREHNCDAVGEDDENDLTAGETASESRCPKDVADKVNSWIDSSVKRTDEYSEEESIFVDDEVNINYRIILNI